MDDNGLLLMKKDEQLAAACSVVHHRHNAIGRIILKSNRKSEHRISEFIST